MVNVRFAIVVALSTAALVACGGSQFALIVDGGPDAGGDDAGGDAGSGADGGVTSDGGGIRDGGRANDSGGGDAGGEVCPPTTPAAGAPCPSVGFTCEYGTSANVACDTIVRCTASGWSPPDVSHCPAGQCPATYDLVPAGQVCSPQGLDCSYPKGTCTCSSSSAGPIQIVDGGVLVEWRCLPASTGCPSPRPRVGEACTQERTSCDYGACAGGVELSCDGGTWQEQGVACPA